MAPSIPPMLLSIPAELRLLIYFFLEIADHEFSIGITNIEVFANDLPESCPPFVLLSLACRQLHTEIMPLMYDDKRVSHVRIFGGTSFARRLNPGLSHLKSIVHLTLDFVVIDTGIRGLTVRLEDVLTVLSHSENLQSFTFNITFDYGGNILEAKESKILGKVEKLKVASIQASNLAGRKRRDQEIDHAWRVLAYLRTLVVPCEQKIERNLKTFPPRCPRQYMVRLVHYPFRSPSSISGMNRVERRMMLFGSRKKIARL